MNEIELKKLFDAVSQYYDIGTFSEFKSKMQTTAQRKSFYDIINSEGYDVGDYNSYETRLSLVKKPIVYTIPDELKNKVGDLTGVQAFQRWLDQNHPGWHRKYGTLNDNVSKGWGKYGPNTDRAWKNPENWKGEYLQYLKVQKTPTKGYVTTQDVEKVAGYKPEGLPKLNYPNLGTSGSSGNSGTSGSSGVSNNQ